MKNERRAFLKKVAYSAPVLVSLGALVEPKEAVASTRPPKDDKSKVHKVRPS